jgi:hypothetical protein
MVGTKAMEWRRARSERVHARISVMPVNSRN